MKFSYSETKIGHSLSCIFYLLLFPGFYFYHQGVGMGVIPKFLGGFFSPVALLAIVLFVLVSRDLIKRLIKSKIFTFIFLSLLCLMTVVSTVEYFGASSEHSSSMYYQVMNTMLLWCSLFLIGAYFLPEMKNFKYIIFVSFFLIVLSLVVYVVLTGSLFYNLRQSSELGDSIATYQGFARSAMVLLFLCYAYVKKFYSQISILLISMFVLFVLGARSEFAAFVLSVIGFSITRTLREHSQALIVVIIIIAAIFGLYFFSDQIMTSRQVQVFDLSNSSSWIARKDLENSAMLRIKNNPILGDVSGHIKEGHAGSYAHNIISAWDSFGILGLIFYLLLMLCPFFKSMQLIFNKKKLNSLQTYFCLLSLACLLLVLVAKSVYWILPGLVWGLYVNVESVRNFGECNA